MSILEKQKEMLIKQGYHYDSKRDEYHFNVGSRDYSDRCYGTIILTYKGISFNKPIFETCFPYLSVSIMEDIAYEMKRIDDILTDIYINN